LLTISFLSVNTTKIFCFVLYKFQDFISYNRIIKYLKENYDFQPHIVHTDYEKALYINFLKNNIYDYKILQTICFFLFTKSIREKMVKLKLSKKKLPLKSYEVLKNIELLCFIDKKNLQKYIKFIIESLQKDNDYNKLIPYLKKIGSIKTVICIIIQYY